MSASVSSTVSSPAAAPEEGNSLWRDAWLRLRKNRLAVFGGAALAFVALACFVGPFLSPYGYEEQNLDLGASAPSAAHWLGTDTLGAVPSSGRRARTSKYQ